MPVVQWIAHVLRATFWLAINFALVTALFLLSAHLGAQPGEDERHAGLFIRGVASLWLYIAAWTWVVRGVFKRPAPPTHKGRVTGKEAAKGSLGCLANLVPIPLVFIFVGRLADWAWAGIRGGDAAHPARQASELLQSRALYVFDHAGTWIPWAVAFIVVYNAARAFAKAGRKNKGRSEASRSARTNRASVTTAAQVMGRPHVQGANEATLAKLRQKGPKPARGLDRPAVERPILAPAGIASAQTVGAAHAGAHAERTASSSGPVHGDRVLGALRFSSSDGGWWAHRDDGGFPVLVAGESGSPDTHALDLARQAVQRSFEVLLRASEAARPMAQARGVGLPRFTIASVRVGAGSAPDVSLSLRCDADANHEYAVRSTDNLQTFKAG
jgi:hypothetical protein